MRHATRLRNFLSCARRAPLENSGAREYGEGSVGCFLNYRMMRQDAAGMKCPRGRYGETEGLRTSQCTSACPLGKYNDLLGARSEDDCKLCPPGRYGSAIGLTTSACSGECPPGKYSSEFGVTSDQACVACPPAYRGWQCEEDAIPRKGTFDGTSGASTREAHAYGGGAHVSQGRSPITFQSRYTLPLKNVA